MKRLLVILVVSILFTSNALAQGWRFSFFFDPKLSWFTSDSRHFDPDGPIAAYNIGITAEKYFSDRYAIMYGASIDNIGGNLLYVEEHLSNNYKLHTRDETYDITTSTSVKYRGQYISVPLNLKFKTIEIGYTSIYVHLGATGHALLTGFLWEDTYNLDKEVIDRDQVYFGYVSYNVGGGIEYSLGGPTALQLGVLFANGLSPAYNAGHGRVSIGSFGLRLGIVF